MPRFETRNYSDAKKTSEIRRRKQENREKKHETSQQREAKHLRHLKKVEVPQQSEQSKKGEGGKQNESRTAIVSDWALQVRDKVSRMASFVWEKKSAIGIGAMLAFARLGVDGRPLGRSNLVEFSHPTAFEPLAYWRKLQANNAEPTVTVSRQSVKDTLNLPQTVNGPMEIPKIDHAARVHLEKLGEKPDQLTREMERYRRRKDLNSSKKISEKIKKDIDNKTSINGSISYERKKLMLGAMLKGAQEDNKPEPFTNKTIANPERAGVRTRVLLGNGLLNRTLAEDAVPGKTTIEECLATGYQILTRITRPQYPGTESYSQTAFSVYNRCKYPAINVNFGGRIDGVCSSGRFEGGQDWRGLANPSTLFVGDEGTVGLEIAASCVVTDESNRIIARKVPDRLFTTLSADGEMSDGKGNRIIAREINAKKVDII